jgi:lysyl-tRNA synthetase class 1
VNQSVESDWVSRFADQVIAEAEQRGRGGPIVCASGLSPSGPIHLGNLREVMTPHLVADEIKRRGVPCEHLLSWDDFDRFRKVPAGIDPAWAEHIGKPLTSVPAPPGSTYPNWAEHFKAPMVRALAELGIEVREISQTAQYTSAAYREQILLAMRERARIDEILDRYRTKGRAPGGKGRAAAERDPAQEASAEGSGAASEDDGKGASGSYFPYRPYCSVCSRDTTTVVSYDDATTALAYVCACGHGQTVLLSEHNRGKLVWKVDWPMRWAFENVLFEPSGVDHSSPGSSFVVGGQIVSEVFGGKQPIGPMYAFVGIGGMAKMSSSRGNVPTPADALEIMEAPLLRWLYSRRKPNQSIKVAFDQEVQRLYDEWDALERKIAAGPVPAADLAAHDRAVRTSLGRLALTPHPVPFSTLVSIADVTTGNPEQILRILGSLDGRDPVTSLDQARPRLDRAQRWVDTQMDPEQRTVVRTSPDTELLATLPQSDREALKLLAERLDLDWSLEGLSTLVYAIPKLQAGLSADAQPTPELKVAQRSFFATLYRLLIGRDTGPRLPTLLLAIGADRVRTLIND